MSRFFCSLFLAGLLILSMSGLVSSDTLAGRQLSLEIDGVPIGTVLSMIAQQNNLNIVAATDVDGEVSIRLVDVELSAALDAILAPLGLNYVERNEVIIVKSASAVLPGEMETYIARLKYIDATTAAVALEQIKSQQGVVLVLNASSDGSASDLPRIANRVFVNDYPEYVQAMQELLSQIDIAQRMISIEVKIVETKVDAKKQLGLSWPTSASAALGTEVTTSDGSESSSEASSGALLDKLAGVYQPNSGDWTWGTLSVDQLRLVMDMLQQDGNSKLVSDPHVTTLENETAEIKVQTIVPIPTINRFTEGGATQDILTFQDEEVGLSLRVTPRINEDNRITLEVNPEVEDIIGYAGPADNQKPITASRSITTRITVSDGETAALGGLLKEDELKNVQKVPLLGDIPILGKLLFSHTSTEKSTTDLIILITPKILP